MRGVGRRAAIAIIHAVQRLVSGITKELTRLVPNKLIDRIQIGSEKVVDGQHQQEIRIVWWFAGEI